jgi:mRNA interferase MazF
MTLAAGDILLLEYPFTDTAGSKLRPALVVSGNAFNQGDDVVVVPISSVESGDPRYAFPLRDVDPFFGATGLRASSFVKWTKPITISRRVVKRKLGVLAAPVLAQVQANIGAMFGG